MDDVNFTLDYYCWEQMRQVMRLGFVCFDKEMCDKDKLFFS